jgi:hypothetical protein
MENGDVREAFGRDPHFIGRKCDKPSESFCPGRDIYVRYFVILRPHDGDDKPFCVARALTGFNDDREHPGCIEIQFYKPARSVFRFNRRTLVGIQRSLSSEEWMKNFFLNGSKENRS